MPGAMSAQTVSRGPYLQLGTPTSIVVKWRTGTSTDSKVFYGTTLQTLNQSVTLSGSRTSHELTISNLSPNTLYYYAVGNAAGIIQGGTSDYHFITSPPVNTQQNIRAWVLGDCGTASSSQTNVKNAFTTYNAGQHLDMTLLLGDNAYDSGLDAEYQAAIFNMYPEALRKTVFWSCLGNHDYGSISTYLDIFTNPTSGQAGGVASGSERYYSFNYGNIHFISLDSHGSGRTVGGSMYNWLQNDLNNVTQDWIIAFWHHPPYSKGSHNSDTETELIQMRQNFLPLLESHGVDLILCGHSHSYERSKFLNGHYGSSGTLNPATMVLDAGNGNITGDGAYEKTVAGPNAGKGAVYVVAGSSGQISGVTQHPVMYTWQNQLGSLLLEVNADLLNVKFIDAGGNVDDNFYIQKQLENVAPLAVDDDATTDAATPAVINVLDNDSDANGQLNPGSVTVITAAVNGNTAVNVSTGAITYTPNPGFIGSETIEYRVCDDGIPTPVLCDEAVVTITVQANLPPTAGDDMAVTTEDEAVLIDVLGNDSDPNNDLNGASISTAGLLQPAHGVTQVQPSIGIEYTPNAGYTGYDQFEYSVCDLYNPLCDVALVTVLVNCGEVTGYNLIKGKVFEDANLDGINMNENGQAGVTVRLYNDTNKNGIVDNGETQVATDVTDGQGEYSFSVTPPYSANSLNAAISLSTDDALQKTTASLDISSTKHDLGAVGTYVGLRFQNLNIPQNAVITNAYLEFRSSRNETSGTPQVRFYSELNTAPATFVAQNNNISNRTFSTSNVTWSMSAWSSNLSYQSPNITPIIQEVVNLGTWAPGKALVIIGQGISTGTVKRQFYTYNNSAATAPKLHIEFEVPGQDSFFYVMDVLPSSMPFGTVLTPDNIETTVFTENGQASCLNDFGFFSGAPPTVNITAPVNNTTLTSIQSVTIQANASDSDGTVAQVDFYVNGNLIGTDNSQPYTADYTFNLNGSYLLTAKATDNHGLQTQSSPINLTMAVPTALPTVSITSPTNGTVYTTAQTVNIAASASDPDGTVTQVEFLVDNNSIGVDLTSPYTASFNLNTPGTYEIKAVATDNLGSTANHIISVILDPPPVPVTATFMVQAASDDAREKNDGSVSVTQNPHEIGKEGYLGIRFQNITIPAGATITAAKLIFQSSANESSNPSSVDIYGQATANPATFVTTANNLSARPRTTNKVAWTFGSWVTNQVNNSPDLTAIVQVLVNDPMWANGNSMAFLLDATGTQRRKAFSFESGQVKAPKLEITYLAEGSLQAPGNDDSGVEARANAANPAVIFLQNLVISPNPARDEVMLEFYSAANQTLHIRLLDVSGRLVQLREVAVEEGYNKIKYPISGNSEGLHFIHLENAGFSISKKIMLVK